MNEEIAKAQLIFKYDVKNNSINSNTVAESILCVNDIIRELNKEYNKIYNSNQIIDINLKPFEKKCFKEIFEIIGLSQPIISSIFNIKKLEYVKILAKSFIKILDLKKFLKGEEPVEIRIDGEKTIVTNINGNNNTVHNNIYNLYTNSKNLKKDLSEFAEITESDDQIKEFEVTDEDEEEIIIINKEDCKFMKKFEEIAEKQQRIIKHEKVDLFLRINLKQKKRLGFAFQGYIINTEIEDKDFIKKVDEGEKFSNGDKLEVNLVVIQEFDPKFNTYINKTIIITKVLEHKLREYNRIKLLE